MDDTKLRSELEILQGALERTTVTDKIRNRREEAAMLANEAQERHEKLRKTVADLQESLDYLRLSIKYMVFDLEATRRENAYLRKMLEGGGQ